SIASERKWTRLVVIRGKPCARSKRIWRPNRLRVPVPVRSPLGLPPSITSRSRSSYGVGTVIRSPFARAGPGCCHAPPDRRGSRGPGEARRTPGSARPRSEEHTSELQSRFDLVCRLLLEKKNKKHRQAHVT